MPPASIRAVLASTTVFLAACGGNPGSDSTAPQFLANATVVNNVAVYSGMRSQYAITRTSTGYAVKDNVTGVVTDIAPDNNVRSIKFADITINLGIGDLSKTLSAADLKVLIELYVAFFNRVPDADGLSYWIGQYKAGQLFDSIALNFYNAAVQYAALTGYSNTMSNDDFVLVIYKNVLGRSGATAPPAADVQYWSNQLASGSATKGSLIRTMLTAAHAYANDPVWGWVPRLLDNKATVANLFAVQNGITYNTPEDSITKAMAIAAAVTSSDVTDAINLAGLADAGFNLLAGTAAGSGATGSGQGSSMDCANPALVTPGNSYQVDMVVKSNGSVVQSNRSTYKVNGGAVFKGNSANEIVIDSTVTSGVGAGLTTTVKSYLRPSDYAQYGFVSNASFGAAGAIELTTTLTPPPPAFRDMAINTPYTTVYTSKTESVPPVIPPTVTTVTSTQTFLGVESVTVPAGTFMACKFKESMPAVAGVSTTIYQWLAASGKYQGLFLKSDDLKSNTNEATRLVINGS